MRKVIQTPSKMKKPITSQVKAFTFLIFVIYFNTSIVSAQATKNTRRNLQGEMELYIDVSGMKDTAGKFLLVEGAEHFPIIKNNMLVVKRMIEEPRRAFLIFYPHQQIKANPDKQLNGIAAEVSNVFEFLAVPGKSRIDVKGTLANSEVVDASQSQEKFASLLKLKTDFEIRIAEEKTAVITGIKNATDSQVRDSLINAYYKYYREQYPQYYTSTILGFVRENPDEPASLFELEQYSRDKKKNLQELKSLYEKLTPRIKALPTAQRIYGTIDGEHFAIDSLIGKPAPHLTLSDPYGKKVSLKDFQGKITLLEFWASWCGACRAANPALLKVYKKYHGKGFRILGISVDDDRNSWLKAIKDDGLDWIHVSDLKGFKKIDLKGAKGSYPAELYHVYSIPTNFLIDETGKVIAARLDEKQLIEFLEKYLQKDQ